jgi:hypothetical protein
MDVTVDDGFCEITIHPDGRVYVFGLTAPLLELLSEMPTKEQCWQELHRAATADAAGPEE